MADKRKGGEKHGTAHELMIAGIWVVGAIIAIRLLPILIGDLSNMVAMVTGGIAAVNVSPGATATTGTATAPATSGVTSSQPNGSLTVNPAPAPAPGSATSTDPLMSQLRIGRIFNGGTNTLFGINPVGPSTLPSTNLWGFPVPIAQ